MYSGNKNEFNCNVTTVPYNGTSKDKYFDEFVDKFLERYLSDSCCRYHTVLVTVIKLW